MFNYPKQEKIYRLIINERNPMNSTKLHKSFSLFLNLLFISSFFTFASSPSGNAIVKAQPELIQIAAVNPGQVVNVIVQKVDKATIVEEQVIRSGGQVTQDLKIINAFGAEMTSRAALELARSSHVRWVSLDAAVISSACTACIDTTNLANAYIRTIKADQLWNKSPYIQGKAIGVAVIDSGINPNGDLFTVMG